MKSIPTIPSLPAPLPSEASCIEQLRSMNRHFSATNRQLQVLIQRRTAERSLATSTTSSSAAQCPICMESMQSPDSVITLCGHIFHLKCMKSHFRSPSSNCPICRNDIHPAELIVIRNGLPDAQEDLDTSPASKLPVEPIDKNITDALTSIRSFTEKIAFTVNLNHDMCREFEVDKDIHRRELDKEQLELKANMKRVKEERRVLEEKMASFKRKEEDIATLKTEMKQQLCQQAKIHSDLKIKQDKLSQERIEVLQEGERLEKAQGDIREKESRLNVLLSDQRPMKRRKPTMSPTVPNRKNTMAPITPFNFTPEKRPTIMVFGGDSLRKPSQRARPSAPRRAGGLQSFLPSRPKTTKRPMLGVAQTYKKK